MPRDLLALYLCLSLDEHTRPIPTPIACRMRGVFESLLFVQTSSMRAGVAMAATHSIAKLQAIRTLRRQHAAGDVIAPVPLVRGRGRTMKGLWLAGGLDETMDEAREGQRQKRTALISGAAREMSVWDSWDVGGRYM